MTLDRILNLYTIIINVLGLMVCVFRHVNRPRRAWVYAIVFELCSLLSNYYWGAYNLLLKSDPTASSILAYFGWNLSYVPLVLLLVMRGLERREKFFSPLCLLPIPLNLWQFTLYLPYGGLFNNIWQSVWCTAIACLCLHGILCYWANRKKGSQKPYVAFVLLVFVALEYTMWTSSCFDWPGTWLDPYTYASILVFIPCLALPWAISKVYGESTIRIQGAVGRFQAVIKPIYIGIVLVCCLGGYVTAFWMRNVLNASVLAAGEPDPYSIIAVTLFIFAMILVVFSIVIIMVLSFGNRAAQSDELRREKAIAERSNAAKTDFLASMSHEIRTPINAVLGMNEMVLRESVQARDALPGDREQIRKVFSDLCVYSANIESAGNNLLSIVNDILDFSKIEAGRMDIVNGPYRLSSVLNDAVNLVGFRARDKRLEFKVDLDETLPDGLCGDEPHVRQILTNLLTNAVKYTIKGRVVLSVQRDKGQPDAEGAVSLKISVRDTGIGIRREDIDKLFAKFERLDLVRNSTVEGTGLGLAITHRLLEMMNGRIEVRSEYGKGSDFTVYLRQQVVSAEPIGNFRERYEKSLQETKAYEESFRAPDARILIVDDTRMNLTVAQSLLKSTEIRIDTALSGAESIELARGAHYDLILMDQRMPVMDGTEAMQQIRAQKDGLNLETPVICLTADAVSGAKDRYLAAGFSDYLSKPIDGRALERMLMKHLPKEKLLHRDYGAPKGDQPVSEAEAAFLGLRAAGLDPAVGLKYCQNDAVLYRSLLSDYIRAAESRLPQLQSFYEAGDWKNYGIQAHSLKSTSKLIGASSLAGIAARMEAAANEGDLAALRGGHEGMLSLYRATVQALVQHGAEEAGQEETEDAEILEFLPEAGD